MKKIKKIAGKRKEKENREKRKENEKATTGGLRQEPPVTALLPAHLHKNPRPGHVSLQEGLRCLAREPLPGTRVSPGWAPTARPGAPPGDTFLSRKGSGASPESPSWEHVSLSDRLRRLAREPLPGTRFSPGRAPMPRPGASPG